MYHNVLSSVRKAVQHLPHIKGRGEDDFEEEWDSEELNQYCRDILRLNRKLRDEHTTHEDRIEFLKHIGHLSFTGGNEASKCAGLHVLPQILVFIQNRNYPVALSVQALKTLSEVCHRSKDAQKQVADHEGGLDSLGAMTGETENLPLSRWACYVLTILIADNIYVARRVLKIPNIEDHLRKSATFPHPWHGWPENQANLLLRLLGLEPCGKTTDKT